MSDSLSTEKNTVVVQLINLRVGEFESVCLLSACLPGIYGNNFMISILYYLFIITSACVAEMPLENFDGFSVEQFASEEREEKLVSCKSYTDLYCS